MMLVGIIEGATQMLKAGSNGKIDTGFGSSRNTEYLGTYYHPKIRQPREGCRQKNKSNHNTTSHSLLEDSR